MQFFRSIFVVIIAFISGLLDGIRINNLYLVLKYSPSIRDKLLKDISFTLTIFLTQYIYNYISPDINKDYIKLMLFAILYYTLIIPYIILYIYYNSRERNNIISKTRARPIIQQSNKVNFDVITRGIANALTSVLINKITSIVYFIGTNLIIPYAFLLINLLAQYTYITYILFRIVYVLYLSLVYSYYVWEYNINSNDPKLNFSLITKNWAYFSGFSLLIGYIISINTNFIIITLISEFLITIQSIIASQITVFPDYNLYNPILDKYFSVTCSVSEKVSNKILDIAISRLLDNK